MDVETIKNDISKIVERELSASKDDAERIINCFERYFSDINKDVYDSKGVRTCPLCGGKMNLRAVRHPSHQHHSYYYECENEKCGLTFGYGGNFFSTNELMEAWNSKVGNKARISIGGETNED